LSGAHDFIKKNKIVSGISGLLSNIPGPVGSIAGAINKGSSALGYGRRRRVYRRRGRGYASLLKNTLRSIARSGGRRRRVYRRRRVGGSLRSILSSAHGFAKKHQLASKLLGHLGHSKLAAGVSSLGYGRRRRVYRRRRRVGGSLRSILSSAHGFVKKNQLASKLLGHLGHSKLASAASSLGYGRRRRRVHRRARGGANYFSTSQIAAPKF